MRDEKREMRREEKGMRRTEMSQEGKREERRREVLTWEMENWDTQEGKRPDKRGEGKRS